MKRKFNLVPVAMALFFGSAFMPQGQREAVECPPGVLAGTYVPETDTYYFGRGDSPARIVESYGSLRWQALMDLNPYLEERLSFDVTVGDRTYLIYADVAICEPLQGLQVLGLVPADLADEEPELATTPVVTPPPPTEVEVNEAVSVSEGSSPNWWMLLFFAAAVIVFWLFYNRRFLKKDVAGLVEQRNNANRVLGETRREHTQAFRELNESYDRQLDEQRQIDFEVRRSTAAPLPDGVEDAMLAGPPMRPEGMTEWNRDEVLEEAARAAYGRLHPGEETDGLIFERQNVRRVLISSRPGETFQMTFGDDELREVTLVREPGWIFNAVIRRGDEVIQELEGICVVGFCANTFEYRRSWIVGALVEPYEYLAVHSAPDWEAVEAERVSRQVTLHSVGDQVVATIGGEPVAEADFFVIETEDEVEPGEDGLAIGSRMRLVPKTGDEAEPEAETEVDTESAEETAVTAGSK
ncbi:MAG: hypothetical protein KJI72_03805 [Patescibacteria group bacterium]|nr:hypothetical protein [Patescibacteria group bacterium]